MDVNSKSKSMGVNGRTRKVTWRVEILSALSAVDSKSKSMNVNGQITKVTWRIENFSSTKDKKLYSENFIVDGNKWRILIFPKGNNVDRLSAYLDVADSVNLPSGWTRYAEFGFAIIDQINRKTSITKVARHEFNGTEADWGFTSVLPLSELHDPKRGYLVNDACLIEVYVSTDRAIDLISHELIVETDSDEHKTEEADCVKADIDIQKTTVNKPEELTTPPTQPSCQIVAIKPEEATEADMNTFFTSLESELSSSKIVFSQDEAKEAVAKVEEALNMTPVNFYNSDMFPLLKQAFKILASFDCSPTTLTIEQKDGLLAMEEGLKELAERAAKAMQDKKCLTSKESVKLTINRNLDRNLIRYKEIESEVKHVEQKLAALMAERKEIFRSSKEMKLELQALDKEWPEYEANAKVAEEEDKTVEAEWRRMKDFISFIKEKI